MQDLQTFIDLLSRGKNFHICILDLSGILNTPLTNLPTKNIIHSKPICDVAKSTDVGYKRCLFCKGLANAKAVKGKKPFSGYCPWGLYEAALPVIKDSVVCAIIYVGNYIIDENKTVNMIKRSSKVTGIDVSRIEAHLSECEYSNDTAEPHKIAEIVRDYLLMLAKQDSLPISENHWLVTKLKKHADEFYCNDISLRDLAKSYHKNEKYMGRLFKKEVGVSFSEYCNDLRLEKSEKLLLSSDIKIIDIALECGFNNVSYFNRLFKSRHGISPEGYRKRG